MKELIQDIIYYLENNKNVTYDMLENYITKVNKSDKEPRIIIDILESEGVFYNINGFYRLLPNDYKIGTLMSSIKGNTYVILNDNKKLDIEKEYLNGALPNDKIIYSLEGKVIKILKRKSLPVLCQVKEKNGNKVLVPHNVKGVLNLRINAENLKKLSDGDYILVKRQNTANNGEIVVALIGDEATVKTFYKEKDHIRLQPENSTMDPIIVPTCEILGKVAGVFRKL